MNKIKKSIGYFIALGIICLCASSLDAQERYFDERYIYSQGFLNPVLLNPAAAGFSGDHNILLNYRNNWSSFEGSPKSVTLAYDGRLIDRVGIGAIIMQDNFGSLRTSKAQLSFTYGITSTKNDVRFGLSTEFIQHGLNNRDANDGNFDPNDPLVLERRNGIQFFDVSIGAYGVYDGKFTYGFALPSLLSSRLTNTSSTNSDGRDIGFLFQAGYILDEVANGISLEPSIVFKKLHQVPTHLDLNLKAGFLEDKFTGGLSYTLGGDKRLGFLIGFKIEKLNLYYTYNVSTQQFQDYNNGAHEFSVKFSFGKAGLGI